MAMTLITTNTGSGVSTSDFTSGIDSTYKLYIFKFLDLNPATDGAQFSFQANAVGASGYNETITSSAFTAYNYEDDGGRNVAYEDGNDQAQGTAFQKLTQPIGSGGDESAAGTLFLLNPSNTTYVKHFYSRFSTCGNSDAYIGSFTAGYINDTTAIDEIQFKMESGNFDGVIQMYGIA